jgi:hypothetical protein
VESPEFPFTNLSGSFMQHDPSTDVIGMLVNRFFRRRSTIDVRNDESRISFTYMDDPISDVLPTWIVVNVNFYSDIELVAFNVYFKLRPNRRNNIRSIFVCVGGEEVIENFRRQWSLFTEQERTARMAVAMIEVFLHRFVESAIRC